MLVGTFAVYAFNSGGLAGTFGKTKEEAVNFGHSSDEVVVDISGIKYTLQDAITQGKIGAGGTSSGSGTTQQFNVGPPGCNYLLTMSNTCNTGGCERCTGSGCTSQYYTCEGLCGANGLYSEDSVIYHCATLPSNTDPATYSGLLVGNRHTAVQCRSASPVGAVKIIENIPICAFTAGTCPGGWVSYDVASKLVPGDSTVVGDATERKALWTRPSGQVYCI